MNPVKKILIVIAIALLTAFMGIFTMVYVDATAYHMMHPSTKKPAGIRQLVWFPEPYSENLVITDFDANIRLFNSRLQGVVSNQSATTGYDNIYIRMDYLDEDKVIVKSEEFRHNVSINPNESAEFDFPIKISLRADTYRVSVASADAFKAID